MFLQVMATNQNAPTASHAAQNATIQPSGELEGQEKSQLTSFKFLKVNLPTCYREIQIPNLGEGIDTVQHLLASTWVPEIRNISSYTRDDAFITTRSSTKTRKGERLHTGIVVHKSIAESNTSLDSSQKVSDRHCTLQFPEFLLPPQFKLDPASN